MGFYGCMIFYRSSLDLQIFEYIFKLIFAHISWMAKPILMLFKRLVQNILESVYVKRDCSILFSFGDMKINYVPKFVNLDRSVTIHAPLDQKIKIKQKIINI